MQQNGFIIKRDDRILVTGATGFIGSRLVETLVDLGFRNLGCLARPGSNLARLEGIRQRLPQGVHLDVIVGDLLSRADCNAATAEAAVIFHLAVGMDGKSFAGAFLNSVVTTRNLLDATLQHACLRRFVNVSSFAVYTNRHKSQGRLLDESCPVESKAELRFDAYTYAKVKQDEIVAEYGRNHGIPYVIVRPGYVYGLGHEAITNRVGIDTFGIFLHLGGSNRIPFTYVDNCAEGIAMAGLKSGTDGEVFNIVDDDLPSSRRFLRMYKRNVRRFRSIYLPHWVSYGLCCLWEEYAKRSRGQLEPAFNRRMWHTYWKRTHYSNAKLKRVGWSPKVPTAEGLRRYFDACRIGEHQNA